MITWTEGTQLVVKSEGRTWHRIGCTVNREFYIVRTRTGKDLLVKCRDIDNPTARTAITYTTNPNMSPASRLRQNKQDIKNLFLKMAFRPFTAEESGRSSVFLRTYRQKGILVVVPADPRKPNQLKVYQFAPDAAEKLERL